MTDKGRNGNKVRRKQEYISVGGRMVAGNS